MDDFIDVIMKEHRKYIKWYASRLLQNAQILDYWLTRCSLYVYNKIDSVSIDYLDKLAREPHTAVMSCEMDIGVQDVVDRSWEELRLIRCYTKRFVRGVPQFGFQHVNGSSMHTRSLLT